MPSACWSSSLVRPREIATIQLSPHSSTCAYLTGAIRLLYDIPNVGHLAVGRGASLNSNGAFKLDWKYAGARAGGTESAYLPERRCNVLLYGATMDGVTDDGAAIQDAIDDCGARGGGTVEVPSGTALVERTLLISSDNVVLRGAGKGETIIKIPHSLLYYDYAAGKSEGDGLQRSRGFLEVRGKPTRSTKVDRGRAGRNYVGKVLAETKAGYRSLQLDDASGVIAGEYIRLLMSDPDSGPTKKSLVGYLYESKDPKSRCGDECTKKLRGWTDLVNWMSRVVEVRGNTIVLERELPVDVRPEWRPVVFTLNEDTVQNSGIQDLAVEFNWKRSQKHLDEDGFNAIVLEDTAFSWVRNVEVVNADLNVVVKHSNFVTVQGIVARVTKDRSHPSSRWKGAHKMGHIGIGGVLNSTDVRTP